MKQDKFMRQLESEQEAIKGRIDMFEKALLDPPRKDFRFGIYYNKPRLLSDEAYREGLTQKFEGHYTRERVVKGEDPAGAREDAERTLSRILEEDADDLESIVPSETISGGHKHLAHRKTNIPEWDVVDYMLLSPDAMYSYFNRMGKSIAFAQKFGGRNIDEVLQDLSEEMEKAGLSAKKIADTRAAFIGDYTRVMGTYRRNPDRLDNQIAKAAKGVTGWTYLNTAGASAITDVGSIVMAHGFMDTFKAGKAAIMSPSYAGNVIKEAQVSGELLDIHA